MGRVTQIFSEAYSEAPAGVWAAPGRVNLIGEHTDYNQGFVLPFALPSRTLVAAGPGPGPGRWEAFSEQTGETVSFDLAALRPGAVTGWGGYVAGVVWALREAGYDVPGARMAIDSQVPVGAGLSSSAALTCAVLTALVDLAGFEILATDRVRLAHRAESGYTGVPSGIMDQSASIRCRAGEALFLDCRTGYAEPVPLDLPAAGLAMLVIDTRVRHQHATGEYAVRRTSCERAAAALGLASLRELELAELDRALARLPDELSRRRVRHVVTENQRVRDTVALLRTDAAGSPPAAAGAPPTTGAGSAPVTSSAGRTGGVRGIGRLLSASHASLRDDYEVSAPELDLAAQSAEAAGAHGARMTGGGFGGCVIALVDDGAVDSVAAAVTAAFSERGYPAPHTFTAIPSSGATRLA